MKKLIVEAVNHFRAEVRAHARASGQIRRQDRFVFCPVFGRASDFAHSLPIPSRDDIIASPIQEDAPTNGATSGYYSGNPVSERAPSPVMDDPSAELERELAETHIGRS